MTSTEFAAKYRLLKNVATRGARTFLAQQVALGRMVMVHYIDAEPAAERGDPVSRLRTLAGAGKDKLLEIVDVDGSPVAVTLFISSFVDFSTWLDQVAAPAAAKSVPGVPDEPEITAPRRPISRAPGAELRMPAPQVPEPTFGEPRSAPPTVSPSSNEPTPIPASRGEFTQFFGRLSYDADLPAPVSGTHTSTPDTPAVPPDVPDFTGDSATLIMEPPKAPVAADVSVSPPPTPAPARVSPPTPLPAPVSPPPAARAEEPADASFTAIFGAGPVSKVSAPSPVDPARGLASPLPAPLPTFGAPPAAERVMPFPTPMPERPAPVPIAAPEPAPAAGEFTQLFQRLNNTAPTSPPSVAPEPARPMDALPSADISSAPPAPRFAMQPPPPTMPSAPSAPSMPPAFGAEPPRAPNAPWGGATIPTESAPSDYTRILGRISPLPEPNQPALAKAPSVSVPEASPAPAVEPRSTKSYLPLIIALNAVAIATVGIVLYFVLKK